MTPKQMASIERMFGLGCATFISVVALWLDGVEAMVIAGGSAAAAAGVGTFFGARGAIHE